MPLLGSERWLSCQSWPALPDTSKYREVHPPSHKLQLPQLRKQEENKRVVNKKKREVSKKRAKERERRNLNPLKKKRRSLISSETMMKILKLLL